MCPLSVLWCTRRSTHPAAHTWTYVYPEHTHSTRLHTHEHTQHTLHTHEHTQHTPRAPAPCSPYLGRDVGDGAGEAVLGNGAVGAVGGAGPGAGGAAAERGHCGGATRQGAHHAQPCLGFPCRGVWPQEGGQRAPECVCTFRTARTHKHVCARVRVRMLQNHSRTCVAQACMRTSADVHTLHNHICVRMLHKHICAHARVHTPYTSTRVHTCCTSLCTPWQPAGQGRGVPPRAPIAAKSPPVTQGS